MPGLPDFGGGERHNDMGRFEDHVLEAAPGSHPQGQERHLGGEGAGGRAFGPGPHLHPVRATAGHCVRRKTPQREVYAQVARGTIGVLSISHELARGAWRPPSRVFPLQAPRRAASTAASLATGSGLLRAMANIAGAQGVPAVGGPPSGLVRYAQTACCGCCIELAPIGSASPFRLCDRFQPAGARLSHPK